MNGPVYKMSAIAGEIETTNLELKNIHVSIVAIVFQIDQKIMEKRLESLIDGLLPESQ